MSENKVPTAFISYSWDSESHKLWVRDFAAKLRGDGVAVVIDRWETVPGDQLPQFMEQAVRDNQYVLVVCTEKYRKKSDAREGGVGYEGDIMTAELFANRDHRKFIPVLRSGDWGTSVPTWLKGKYGIDLRGEPYSDQFYHDLLTTIHKQREQAPPVGPVPSARVQPQSIREAAKPFLRSIQNPAEVFKPVKIEGVIADEVGIPLNDGSRGSALYPIPFRLSYAPTHEWGDLFIRSWAHPPRYSTMHRPGIAVVERDRIILRGTTIEEVQKYHRDTLKLCVDVANSEMEKLLEHRRAVLEAKAKAANDHKENVRRIAGDISFD